MHILFIAMADSIHTARWINQITDQAWDIHLFPSENSTIHRDLRNLTVHDYIFRPHHLHQSVRLAGVWPWPFPRGANLANYRLKRWKTLKPLAWFMRDQSQRLARLIDRLKPDIVHSLEIQHAGYLTLEARGLLGGSFPTWIVTNWGSDIYFFGRLPEHAEKIKAVLSACDYYDCECQRDVDLGRAFGFRGEVLPVLPNTGGFNIERIQQLRSPGPTSARRLILLKGYQGWAGRALVGLRAIELAAASLSGYRVAIYLAGEDVQIAAERLSRTASIPVTLVPYCPHEEMLRLHGQARVSIGLNISDAISTSFLEAIALGSFPIQSNTGCADEWIRDGETGFLVPPEDPEVIAAALRRAVTDDALVDRAANLNAQLVAQRLDCATIKAQVIATYGRIAARAVSREKF